MLACNGILRVRREGLEKRQVWGRSWLSLKSKKVWKYEVGDNQVIKEFTDLKFSTGSFWWWVLAQPCSISPSGRKAFLGNILQVCLFVCLQAQHAGAGRGADDLGQLLHGVHHAGGANNCFIFIYLYSLPGILLTSIAIFVFSLIWWSDYFRSVILCLANPAGISFCSVSPWSSFSDCFDSNQYVLFREAAL